MAPTIEILVYQKDNEKAPFYKWLDTLELITISLIEARLNRLRQGNFGDCKFIGEGIGEIRIDYGPGYRIYFGKINNSIILLLNAGDKNGQNQDIKKAKEYWVNYRKSRHGKNTQL
jgi:putative addiction module killer protein